MCFMENSSKPKRENQSIRGEIKSKKNIIMFIF
jgi:hypothetical protein